MKRVLIVAPSLDLAKNVSGVSAVANFIIAHNKECQYEHFLQGRGDGERGPLKRIHRLLLSYREWKRLLHRRSDIVIHYNFPLDAPSVLRDYFFLKAAHNRQMKMVIHLHGGLFLFKENKPYIIRLFLNEIFSWNNPFIVLSNKEREQIQKEYHTKNVFVLPNCVDLPQNNQFPDFNESKLHILYLGRIEPNKGIDYLYDAMKTLRQNESPFVLHFAGIEQGGNDYVHRFQQLLGDRFVYEGVVSGNKKADLMRRCQIFVLPSFYEGLPMSLLEAMSFGEVPVVTDVGSIGEYVENNQNGLLILPRSSVSIIESLNRLFYDRELLLQLSVAARQTISSRLSPENYVKDINLIYAQTV